MSAISSFRIRLPHGLWEKDRDRYVITSSLQLSEAKEKEGGGGVVPATFLNVMLIGVPAIDWNSTFCNLCQSL